MPSTWRRRFSLRLRGHHELANEAIEFPPPEGTLLKWRRANAWPDPVFGCFSKSRRCRLGPELDADVDHPRAPRCGRPILTSVVRTQHRDVGRQTDMTAAGFIHAANDVGETPGRVGHASAGANSRPEGQRIGTISLVGGNRRFVLRRCQPRPHRDLRGPRPHMGAARTA